MSSHEDPLLVVDVDLDDDDDDDDASTPRARDGEVAHDTVGGNADVSDRVGPDGAAWRPLLTASDRANDDGTWWLVEDDCVASRPSAVPSPREATAPEDDGVAAFSF